MQLTKLLLSLIAQTRGQKLVLVACHCLGLQDCGGKCLLFNLSIILRGIPLQIFHSPLLEFLHSDNQSLVNRNYQTLKYCLFLVRQLLLEFFVSDNIFIFKLFLHWIGLIIHHVTLIQVKSKGITWK